MTRDFIIREFRNTDSDKFIELVEFLYREDITDESINIDKIQKTINELSSYPEKGVILIFEKDSEIIGYSILIYHWSNEYGGNLIFIDEIYIRPEYRNKGIGKEFINFLRINKYNNSKGIQLEVSKTNKNALAFYKNLGFKLISNISMIYKYL